MRRPAEGCKLQANHCISFVFWKNEGKAPPIPSFCKMSFVLLADAMLVDGKNDSAPKLS